jgi:hypothetical protein
MAGASPFREQLGGEALSLGDSLDLDRNGFERLLHALETLCDLGWNARVLGFRVHPPRVGARYRNANGEDDGAGERAKRHDYLWSHFNQSSRRQRRLRVS